MQTKSKASNKRVTYAYLLKVTRQLRKKAQTEKILFRIYVQFYIDSWHLYKYNYLHWIPSLSKRLKVFRYVVCTLYDSPGTLYLGVTYYLKSLKHLSACLPDTAKSTLRSHLTIYRPCAIIPRRLLIQNRSWLQIADFRPTFPSFVHKLFVISTALDYESHWKMR